MPFLPGFLLSCAVCLFAILLILRQLDVKVPFLRDFADSLAISSDELAERAFAQYAAGKVGGNDGALALFRKAILRDPASPYRWADYGEALLGAGDPALARKSMERAAELGPRVGPILLRLLLFSYRVGDREEALHFGRRTLEWVPEYDSAVFQTYGRMDLPVSEILQAGIPDARSGCSYLRALMNDNAVNDAETAWSWSLSRGFVDDAVADEYAGFLMRSGRESKAVQAWADRVRAREPGYPLENAVFNGGFERESAGKTFDWQMYNAKGVQTERDSRLAAEGGWSLRLTFDGTENVDFAHVIQRACVTPGGYLFEGKIKTDGITTDQGVGFLLFDADSPERFWVTTRRLTGTNEWTTLATRFAVRPGTKSIYIRVARSVSLRFDSRVAGTAWIDAVVLRRER